MLDVVDLCKTYSPTGPWLRPFVKVASRRPVEALRSVSFSVPAGEVVGLVGANGAGKTTLIKVIATLLEPTSGCVKVDGLDVVEHAHLVRQRVGLVLAEDRGLYWRLSGLQNLTFYGVMAGLPRGQARNRALELMGQVGLPDAEKLVFGYSVGMRSRLNIARALLGDPALLVLDEPSRSLDPVASADLVSMLRRLANEGRAVLIASHRPDEVLSLCDRVIVMAEGRVRHVGAMTDLAGGERTAAQALVQLIGSDAVVE